MMRLLNQMKTYLEPKTEATPDNGPGTSKENTVTRQMNSLKLLLINFNQTMMTTKQQQVMDSLEDGLIIVEESGQLDV